MLDFLKYQRFYFLFSALLIVLGMVNVFSYGFKYSLDFVGGGLVEYTSTNQNKLLVKKYLQKQYPNLSYQGTQKGFILKGKNLEQEKVQKLSRVLQKKYQTKQIRFEKVGPTVSSSNIYKTTMAAVLAALSILLYIAFTYKSWRFGLAAVVALVHDLLMLLGIYSLLSRFFGFEFDVLFITAMLTTMSFSTHDTIVIFDKIREEASKKQHGALEERINLALNLTVSRSINNSLTQVIMLTALLILGGDTIRAFTCALLIGTITGTYSSPFIATPIYYLFEKNTHN